MHAHKLWYQAAATSFSQCSTLLYVLWSPHNRIMPDSCSVQACFLCYLFSSSLHHSCELCVRCSDLIEQPGTPSMTHTSCGFHFMHTESYPVAFCLGLIICVQLCLFACSLAAMSGGRQAFAHLFQPQGSSSVPADPDCQNRASYSELFRILRT